MFASKVKNKSLTDNVSIVLKSGGTINLPPGSQAENIEIADDQKWSGVEITPSLNEIVRPSGKQRIDG